MLADWDAHPYAYRVRELLVFGSYLTDVPTLGDVDLAVVWAHRFSHPARHWSYMEARIRLANGDASGRALIEKALATSPAFVDVADARAALARR